MLKIIDKYIVQRYIVNTFFIAVLAVGIINVYDFLSNIDTLLNLSGDRSLAITLGEYFFYKSFSLIDSLLLPLLPLGAALWVISSMINNHEIIAIMSMGIPCRRTVIPLILTTVAIFGLAFAVREFLIPQRIERIILTPNELSFNWNVLH